MREKLKSLEGRRLRFRGTFKRLGKKAGWQGATLTTVLLVDIVDMHGNPMCDHLWFNMTKEFAGLEMNPGEQVDFTATVSKYAKGYQGWREDWDMGCLPQPSNDYRLSRPFNICRAGGHPPESLPLFRDSLKH